MKIEQLPEATESVEQQRLMQWARMESGKWPELALLYHVPNEGKRSRTAGARMKAEGLKKGVPDLCLPVARGGCHGLYIELKREKSGKATAAQIEWMEALMREGYAVSLCHGWEAAAKTIRDYLETGETPECCLIWLEGSKRPPAVRWNPDADDLISDAWEVTEDWYEP